SITAVSSSSTCGSWTCPSPSFTGAARTKTRSPNRPGYNREVRPLQVGLKFARHALVAVYGLAFIAMPFAHHDLACHLKSSTHCATCHVGTSTDPNSARPGVDAVGLADAGAT